MKTISWDELRMHTTSSEYEEDENHNSYVAAAWIGERKFVPQDGGSVFVEVTHDN